MGTARRESQQAQARARRMRVDLIRRDAPAMAAPETDGAGGGGAGGGGASGGGAGSAAGASAGAGHVDAAAIEALRAELRALVDERAGGPGDSRAAEAVQQLEVRLQLLEQQVLLLGAGVTGNVPAVAVSAPAPSVGSPAVAAGSVAAGSVAAAAPSAAAPGPASPGLASPSPAVAAPAPAAARAPGAAPATPPRCLAHGGAHLLGATMAEVTECWATMRDRFGEATPNKVKARQSLIAWMERQKGVCPDSVLWFGDFVAIRSCPARGRAGEPSEGRDGWWVLFDPNSSGYRSSTLFLEAFATGREPGRGMGAMDLSRPAWLSEEHRFAEARKLGLEQSRPFTSGAVDHLTEAFFVRGEAR